MFTYFIYFKINLNKVVKKEIYYIRFEGCWDGGFFLLLFPSFFTSSFLLFFLSYFLYFSLPFFIGIWPRESKTLRDRYLVFFLLSQPTEYQEDRGGDWSDPGTSMMGHSQRHESRQTSLSDLQKYQKRSPSLKGVKTTWEIYTLYKFQSRNVRSKKYFFPIFFLDLD